MPLVKMLAMDCPTCHIALKPESLEGQTVDRCQTCDGLWLDDAELGQILRQTRPSSNPAEPIQCRDGIHCPRCESALTSFNYAHDSGVLINKCPSCAGLWRESGQLDLIAQYRSGSDAIQRLGDAVVDEMWGSERTRFLRRLLRSRLLSGGVAIFYLLASILSTARLESAFSMLLFLLLPMACIWFPDAMGNLRGVSFGFGRPKITHSTPGDFVAVGGWLLLLAPVVVPFITKSAA